MTSKAAYFGGSIFYRISPGKPHKLTETNNINKPLRRGKRHLESRVATIYYFKYPVLCGWVGGRHANK